MLNEFSIKTHELNTQGKDFLVADLHGMYYLFIVKLFAKGFNPQIDRLFSLGDLIDRGPHSLKTLQLIDQPWFYPLLGNHELMLLQYLNLAPNLYSTGDDFLPNGGTWIFHEDPQTVIEYAQKTLQTPVMRLVPSASGTNILVHAQLAPIFNEQSDNAFTIPSLLPSSCDANPYNAYDFLWQRDIIDPFLFDQTNAPDWHTTEHKTSIYCGHTIVKKTTQLEQHRFMDRGAYYIQRDLAYFPITEEFLTLTQTLFADNELSVFSNPTILADKHLLTQLELDPSDHPYFSIIHKCPALELIENSFMKIQLLIVAKMLIDNPMVKPFLWDEANQHYLIPIYTRIPLDFDLFIHSLT